MDQANQIAKAIGGLEGALDRINATMDRHEIVIAGHANELAEMRGAARANKWLALSLPPGIVALVELAKAIWHGGHV